MRHSEIDTDIWNAMMLRQGPAEVLIRRAEELTELKELKEAITSAVVRAVLRPMVEQAVLKEVKRYLAHRERVSNYKRWKQHERWAK